MKRYVFLALILMTGTALLLLNHGCSKGTTQPYWGPVTPTPPSPTPTGTPLPGWYFNTSAGASGWAFNYSVLPASPVTSINYDGAFGCPNAGSLLVTIGFTAPNQKAEIGYFPASPINMSGMTATCQVYLNSGLNTSSSNLGGAKIYAKTTTSYYYADGGWVNLDSTVPASCITLSLNMNSPQGYNANPAGWNPVTVVEVGVEIDTGGTGTFTTAALHIDSWNY